jgi:putative transcriptional regulator
MKLRQQKAGRTLTKRRVAHKRAAAKHDWREFDALREADILKAARSDPDAQPVDEAVLKRMKRPKAKVVRQALGLSQEEFAERFKIPVGTLRDWEQGRVEPDQAARAYLMVIARNPKAVRDALEARAASGKTTAAPASATTNFRRAIGTVIGPRSVRSQPWRDDTMFWRLHEPAHTIAVTAGRLLWVINRKAQPEHFSSAFSGESRRSR